MTVAFLLAALSVLPADRLAMADRLFNRGEYAAAAVEYQALKGEKTIAADKLLYRRAECARAIGQEKESRTLYAELANACPDSTYAPHARLMLALGETGEKRQAAFKALDTDRIPADVRAVALYHFGVESGDVAALERCVALAPKGAYADYARLQLGQRLTAAADASVRRKGLDQFLSLAFGRGKLADEALYLAANASYRDGRYGEAGSLFRRHNKMFPKSSRAAEVRTMAVWCDFSEGRFADALAACGSGGSDDLDYLKGAATLSAGDEKGALRLLKAYLDAYPSGRYRSEATLAVARLEFAAASRADDAPGAIEAARRAFAASREAEDELRLAWAYARAGRAEEADAEYACIAKGFPGTAAAAEALFARAMSAARASAWPRAELLLAEALATDRLGERKAEALYWRGVAALNAEHEQEAKTHLEAALKLGLALDEQREARLMIADVDWRAGHVEAARESYAKLVKEGALSRMTASRILAVGQLLGGEGAILCAKALTAGESADWRQAGWTMLGEAEEGRERFTEAIAAFRSALKEPVRTESAATAALRLGMLEVRAGERDAAEATLKEAVELNAKDVRARAEAYLALAENARLKGDGRAARGYATVVVALFDEPSFVASAEKILKACPEEAK